MRCIKYLLISLCLMSVSTLQAQDFVVLGLFKNKVVLKKGGKRMVLKTGESTPDGLKVIDVNSKHAVLEVNGKQDKYELGMQISASFAKPTLATVHIARDNHGMYRVQGRINSSSVNFLVDTGATAIALNANQAKTLNIPYESGQAIVVETASGRSKAYRVKLNSVSVGEITLRDVDAVVVNGASPREVLLGMSFLRRVNMQDDASVMQLQLKY